ncbi:cytochrome P450 [Micromonospora sp. WMMD1102]|uniref:cytochrome P450 n=1 Tax=Micromonospora sp. WMMD1102 TaxID=3016105 RepID=UPI0024153F40|nr:cytochrome P450 [Micromonospora sp. WMMD1102]MDG4789714.1 cytochrome P450 [Micromonospora sp. WMMD1102]
MSILSVLGRPQAQDDLFLRLNREDPVHWDRYAGLWLVSGRSAVEAVLTDKRFSARRTVKAVTSTASDSSGLRSFVHDAIARQALFLDGPEHARWRRIIHHVLEPARVAALEPWIEEATRSLLADLPEQFDLVATVARPLPLSVVVRLLGLPISDVGEIQEWSDAYTRLVTGVNPVTDPQTISLVADFLGYAVDVVKLGRSRRGDDAVGRMVGAAGDATDLDLATNLVMLLAAGHQTTTGFLSAAVLDLLSTAPQRIPRPDLVAADVERLLARISPSRFVGRHVVGDVDLDGRSLQAGHSVLVLLAAANWAETNGDGHAGSAHGRHLAFGFGRHRCPGAQLARLESRVVLRRIIADPRGLSLVDESTPWSDNINLPSPMCVRIARRTGRTPAGATG